MGEIKVFLEKVAIRANVNSNEKEAKNMDKPWKAFERQIAAKMGTTRALNHLSGGGDKSDVDHPIFSIDCKLKKTFSLNDFRELRTNAKKHNKIPVMAYRRPQERLTYCVLDFETFVSLARGAGWIGTDGEVDVKSDADGLSLETMV